MDEILRARREALRRQWALWLAGRTAPGVRSEISASWRRSIGAVDPGTGSAPLSASADWARSPLRAPVEAVAGELRAVAEDAGFVAAVTDERCTILWTCGGTVMSRRAGAVNFAQGGRWDEASMGTNALALALKTGAPSSVFSAEHLVEALHGWVCYCAPIHGPDGSVLGVLDISTTWDRSHPLGLPTVRGLVAAIEGRIGGASGGWRLRCLGGARLLRDGAPVPLRPRQVEILALLALEGRAVPPERLHDALYGERRVSAVTLRAEVSHLRRALTGALSTRAYALTGRLSCDAAEVLAHLDAGRLDEALGAYGGPLLPFSEAPGVLTWREHIEVALREAVLACPRPEPALAYGVHHLDDLAVHEHAIALLPPADPRHAVAVSRARAAR
ncbi:transcriptional regulator [Actinocorallia sp. API 0066]|uniref:helix-turn-helix domain-containing protein n=1 Tax=Actinocorallia sp. API 0066 TaxID=2896846 RepID=UPI001E3932B0|nr:helix-turn-helix domain-containing protein [Actinocorallia sp. API 0066]MCD0452015.1 transcriptional regulator [Actinocorallia sp. API 0066]